MPEDGGDVETMVVNQFNFWFDANFGFVVIPFHMNMDRRMVIRIKEESETE
jgi:hypothetical protein